jgi:hypothetical protein
MKQLALFLSVTSLLAASPAHAERWVKAGENPPVGEDWVDLDSVTVGSDGWTSYRFRMTIDPDDVFESAVRCDQDFSVEKVLIRSRMVIYAGKPKPDQPWTTSSTDVGSMAGQTARFVCHK